MGIIAAALIAAHSQGIGMGVNNVGDLPDWVAFSCFTAISLGTMSGGWKIVRTMGNRITRVTPLEGVVAETAGAFTLIYGISENSGQHHPHHIRSHHRSGRHPSPVRSALGSYPKPDDSLGAYHPGKCGIGSSHLCTDRVTNLFFKE